MNQGKCASKEGDLDQGEKGSGPAFAEEVRFRLAPATAEHREEGGTQDGLGEEGKDRFGEI